MRLKHNTEQDLNVLRHFKYIFFKKIKNYEIDLPGYSNDKRTSHIAQSFSNCTSVRRKRRCHENLRAWPKKTVCIFANTIFANNDFSAYHTTDYQPH